MISSQDTLFLTRREFILLGGLLFLLLFITNDEYVSQLESYVAVKAGPEDTVVADGKGGRYPDPLLNWTDSVPETEIVAHSTGEFSVFKHAFLPFYSGDKEQGRTKGDSMGILTGSFRVCTIPDHLLLSPGLF